MLTMTHVAVSQEGCLVNEGLIITIPSPPRQPLSVYMVVHLASVPVQASSPWDISSSRYQAVSGHRAHRSWGLIDVLHSKCIRSSKMYKSVNNLSQFNIFEIVIILNVYIVFKTDFNFIFTNCSTVVRLLKSLQHKLM